MKNRFAYLPITLIIVLVCSCGTLIVGSDPENSPEHNFELLWREFDKLYSNFVIKKINWDSLYAVYRPQVSGKTSDRELFEITSSMLSNLNDGHVYLISSFRRFVSNERLKTRWAENFDLAIIRDSYLRSSLRVAGGNNFIYGQVAPQIGYLYIATFEDEDFGRIDDWAKDIDEVVQYLNQFQELILDVRHNGGGDAFNAQFIGGRFADQKRLFAFGMSRNGPRHDDFSEPYAWYLEPGGGQQFTKPIALLTNRYTASGAERFTLSMKVLPHVTIIGDTTEGAFPHAVGRELPNGWAYRVTVGVVLTPAMTSYEGSGIPPDVAVNIAPGDLAQRKDTILEQAITILNGKARSGVFPLTYTTQSIQ